jgi:hypothetical protein
MPVTIISRTESPNGDCPAAGGCSRHLFVWLAVYGLADVFVYSPVLNKNRLDSTGFFLILPLNGERFCYLLKIILGTGV